MLSQQGKILNLKLAMITALLLVALVLGACTGAGTDGGAGDSGVEATPTLMAPDDGAGGVATVEPTAETQ